jgi:Protein of unknown function (DUF1684)
VKGADRGAEDGRLVLDFNFAYQPSCSDDSRWTCPLAPPANRLDVRIEAGGGSTDAGEPVCGASDLGASRGSGPALIPMVRIPAGALRCNVPTWRESCRRNRFAWLRSLEAADAPLRPAAGLSLNRTGDRVP